MSQKLKTTQSVYSRYESGEYRLHGELLLQLAKILGVTPNEILGVTNGGNAKVSLPEYHIPPRILRHLRGVEQLSRSDQDVLLTMIDAMISAGRDKISKRKPKTPA